MWQIFNKSFFSSLIFLAFLGSFSSTAFGELKTVPFVDLSRYLGDWYQIAHNPMFFEGGVCACARQRLTLGEKNAVKVYNTCHDKNPNGSLRFIEGEAYSNDPKSNAKFTVDFHLPWKGTYWIIGLDDQYRYAVVTDKHAYSLYILSKTPTLDPKIYALAVAEAAKQVKTSKLVVTEQAGCSYP